MFGKALLILVGGFVAMTGQVQAAGDASAGKAKSETCAMCHGEDGKGQPPLAGLSAAVITKSLKDFKSGARQNKTMQKFAKGLSDADIANLAAYYSSLK